MWFGRGWVDMAQSRLVPYKNSSPYLHVPVTLPEHLLSDARDGIRLDLQGPWTGERFMPTDGHRSVHQTDQHLPIFRGRYLPQHEVRAIQQAMPDAELAMSYRTISDRDDPSTRLTHLEIGVTHVTEAMERWRANHPYGDLVDFHVTAGPSRRYLFK